MSKKIPTKFKGVRRNPVAKHAHKVNRAGVFRDRGQYTRKLKHKGHEPFPLFGLLTLQ